MRTGPDYGANVQEADTLMTTTRFQAMELPIGQVIPSPINVRRDVGDISELTNSIREQGILEPLVVRPTQEGTYEVIIGSRRLASANEIGLAVVPVVIQHISDADAIVRSLVENLQRGELPLEDRVEAYKRLQEVDSGRFGNRQGLARALGRSKPNIDKDFDAYEALVRLRPRGIQVIHNISPTTPQRRAGEAIPETHATLLEQAMSAVRGSLSEDRVEDAYTEMARTIAPLEQERARRVLDYFKMYPDRPATEIESMALATVERPVILPAETARRLEELADNEGTSNWGDTITRLIEKGPAAAQETSTIEPLSSSAQPSLLDEVPHDVPTEQDDGLDSKRPGLLYQPPKLPDAPESIQQNNKVLWNLEHYKVDADFYTIHYAGRDIDHFVEILQAAGVSTLVDIRHNPVSPYKPDFSRANLKAHLENEGIDYIGRPKWGVPSEVRDTKETRDAVWHWYDDNVLPSLRSGGLSELRESAKPPLAFMCLETDPTACHRHRLFLALEDSELRGFDL